MSEVIARRWVICRRRDELLRCQPPPAHTRSRSQLGFLVH